MTLETFFEKFELFAEAPDAVEKMRELVLDMAVRGKLVVQDVRDEPAAQLLKRVLAEKILRTGRIERSDEEPCPPPDDEAFETPANWEWIGAITPAILVSDQGKKVQTKDILGAGKYPVIDQGKMFIRGYCNDSDRVISVAEPIVLFGDHTRETKFIDFDFVVGADGVKLLQPICIDPRFYFMVLRWLPLESRGYARHFKLLRAARIPLPPLAEQKRIVAKVDELMALCDRLEAQQKERDERHVVLARASLARFADAPTPANLQFLFHVTYAIPPADLRKAILTLAVQGKLVPQDPSDEPAMLSSSAPPEDVPNEIPSNWRWVGLAELAHFINGDRSKNYPSKSYRVAEGVPFINAGHLSNGDVSLVDMDYIAEDHFNRLGGGKVERGDVLYCLRGSLGKCAIVSSISRGAIASSLLIVRPLEMILASYMYSYLVSPLGGLMIAKYDNGSAQPNLSAANVKKYLVPLPPFAEQHRIVSKVHHLMAMVDELETQLATSRATAANLLEAVVAELTTKRSFSLKTG